MKIKTLIIIVFVLFASVGMSQIKHSVSLFTDFSVESGEADYGIQYKYNFALLHSLQGNVATSFGSKTLSLGADYIYGLPIVEDWLSFLVGGGLHYDRYNDDALLYDKNVYSFRPQAGFDFRLPQVPLGVFAVYKPKIDLDGFEPIDTSSIQAGIRFYF